jgi:hypothetical protein
VSAGRGWTTVADVVAKVRRRWDDGSLLRAYAAGEPFPAVEVPLRGPRPGEVSERLAEVQAWVTALEHGSRRGRCYDLVRVPVGGRLVGRNQLPARVVIASYEQAWSLLGVGAEAARFDSVLATTTPVPAVRRWAAEQPFRALAHQDVLGQLLAAYAWLDSARGSGRRLRQIEAPDVDTKFVERHRGVLAALLGVSPSNAGFTRDLGLATPVETVRLRFDTGFAGMPDALSEATLRHSELARLRVGVQSAFIVENEATYLAVEVPPGGVVIWGKGFEVDRAGSLPWLRETDVHYWGDLDTHGFAILDRLRAWLPEARSVLMGRDTLLAHRDRWVVEERPTRARLTRLDEAERALYDDLVTDRLGDRVRLEQERIDWEWVEARLPDCG